MLINPVDMGPVLSAAAELPSRLTELHVESLAVDVEVVPLSFNDNKLLTVNLTCSYCQTTPLDRWLPTTLQLIRSNVRIYEVYTAPMLHQLAAGLAGVRTCLNLFKVEVCLNPYDDDAVEARLALFDAISQLKLLKQLRVHGFGMVGEHSIVNLTALTGLQARTKASLGFYPCPQLSCQAAATSASGLTALP